MKKYTVGFIFNKSLKKVLLVHKTAPEWQVGLINGVGGKIEEGEEGVECMKREIKEETNIDLQKEKLYKVGSLSADEPKSYVEVYAGIYKGELFKAYVFEKEKIEWFPIDKLPKNVIPNLRWLIPLAAEKLTDKKIAQFEVKYISF